MGRQATYSKEKAKARKRLYGVWWNMINRCENPKSNSYHHYGARGIDVCKEWHDFDEFYQWAFENGYDAEAPQGKCTLERRNNDRGYYPWNCRWTDMMEQSWNRRPAERKASEDQIERCQITFDSVESLSSFYESIPWSN